MVITTSNQVFTHILKWVGKTTFTYTFFPKCVISTSCKRIVFSHTKNVWAITFTYIFFLGKFSLQNIFIGFKFFPLNWMTWQVYYYLNIFLIIRWQVMWQDIWATVFTCTFSKKKFWLQNSPFNLMTWQLFHCFNIYYGLGGMWFGKVLNFLFIPHTFFKEKFRPKNSFLLALIFPLSREWCSKMGIYFNFFNI